MESGVNTKREIKAETKRFAGVLLAYFIKADGTLVDKELDKKVIGMSLEDLKKIENVMIVAANVKKAKGVLGALNGGYINTLVVNEAQALEVLRLYHELGFSTSKFEK